ncbi:peptide chain release factor N(5)-glutamine methyltransferase [Francisella sp. LA112445]|uniref:peptide chain release factor N(5)-glutamine methyltransferase n=1 Tax=Francisella sp. LA112445 TaxID=1395624 RepID=UPI001788DAA6|nr:peptide chain release factor N(5)-glutamine methyltransferase [Francisella sp. LA112445]QIW10794.1 peptide chain release factor N(5)-glutamine methyltransferase [Francisella sp. LA112445]
MSSYTISSFISYIVESYKQQSKSKYSTNELAILKNDIQAIVCDVLDVDRTYLYLNSDKVLDDDVFEKINTKIHRYFYGEPLAYILGYKYFWNQKLFVTQDTLIPRADTETLVEAVLDDISDKSTKLNILDLGTGTGAIALALASELLNSRVIAVDFSNKALDVAKKNAKENKVSNVEFIQSDWYQNLENKKFDIIVSNPPYIDFCDDEIDHEVKKYEPQSALFAADNGLEDIKTIISQSYLYLNKNARIYIEHGYTQSKAIENILIENEFSNITTVKDLNGKDRCTYAISNKKR